MYGNKNARSFFFYKFSKKNEMIHLEYVCEKITDENFRESVYSNLSWYIQESGRLKNYYYSFSLINIIIPLIISFFEYYTQCMNISCQIDAILFFLPLVVSLSNSLLTFGKFLEKWTKYRSTITQINLFLNKYLDEQNRDNFSEKKYDLHREFDKIIEAEGNYWYHMQINNNNNTNNNNTNNNTNDNTNNNNN